MLLNKNLLKNTVGGLKLQMDKQGRAHLEKS